MNEAGREDTGAVVVGVDGSAAATAAVRAAAREAQRRGAALELVLAFPWAEGSRVAAPESVDGRAALYTMAELALEGAAQAATESGVAPRRHRIVVGHAVQVLTEVSRKAQLLVIGTRGVGTVRDALLGSTAAALARGTHCPLLAVPTRPGTLVDAPRGVVVGLVGIEPEGGLLLAEAFAAAQRRGTELLAVHTWEHRAPGASHLAIDPLVPAADAERREQAWVDDVLDGWPDRYPGVPVRRVVQHGRAAPALLAAALTAELVVVGHRHGRLRDLLGSVSHALLHRAPCPVLVVPLGA